jgi:hypothetical protein
MEGATLLVGVAAIVVSVVMGLYVRALSKQDRADAAHQVVLADLASRLSKIEGVIETQSPFFASIQSHVIDLLHHPDPENARLDYLLERLKSKQIAADEQIELEGILQEMAAHSSDDHQRQAAVALSALMPLVLVEAEGDPAASDRKAREPVRPTTNEEPRKYIRQSDVAISEMAALALDTNEKVTAIKAAQERTNGEAHDGPAKQTA